MNQLELLTFTAQRFAELGIRYFVTGSQASMFYSEPRYTIDIDIAVDLRLGDLHGIERAFPDTEFYLDKNALREAVECDTQVNIIHGGSGIKIDLIHPPRTPFNASRFDRARLHPLTQSPAGEGPVMIRVAAPEDVILMKLVYYNMGQSEKHLRDIASMMRISPELIDRSYIERWAPQLGVLNGWRAVAQKVDDLSSRPLPPLAPPENWDAGADG